ncbi:MAG: D-xylose ABC transporter ATP-binding protein [Planctomycetota bacterium]|nr:MAG: D-xylose ABC transporter ATP-binding protein [Planctomycetota bacterium]
MTGAASANDIPPPTGPAAPLLEVRGVSKRFPGVQALSDIRLALARGEVLALIGENGAGKSTLMKILAGVQPPDSGEILLDGRPVQLDSVRAAQAFGIALIHQELNLADNLDVGANLFLGREPRTALGLIDRAKIYRESVEILRRVGLDVPPRTIVRTLSIGYQQMVEIAKALSANARVLIMDEPTSSLTSGEAARLFALIKDLRGKGVSIIYISHRLGEVHELADRVTVFRDGRNAGDLNCDQITHDNMVRLMVGRELAQFYARTIHEPREAVLEVDSLRVAPRGKHPVSFAVRAGEIVGMAGLVGAGRTELLDTIFGVRKPISGTVRVAGKAIQLDGPIQPIAAGIALVPEDRKHQGLVIEMSVRENVSLAALHRQAKRGWLDRRGERRLAAETIERLRVRTPSDQQIVHYLSGGNQQKVVLGKWLALKPRVLLLDEPTRGVDVGAKHEIYRIMESLAAEGVAVLFVSSDMEEVLGMSDRTLVMHEGRITGELSRDRLSEEAIMQLATGRDAASAAQARAI